VGWVKWPGTVCQKISTIQVTADRVGGHNRLPAMSGSAAMNSKSVPDWTGTVAACRKLTRILSNAMKFCHFLNLVLDEARASN
jgi:hypothetical protein